MADHVIRDTHHGHDPGQPRGSLVRILAGFRNTIVRFYALAVLLVVVWAGYTAVAYLVRTVFTPSHVPEAYRTWEAALPGPAPGSTRLLEAAGMVPRAPVGHYHSVEHTLPVDQHNGCLTSGCHNALAHTKRKEIRAFANLHATFLSCGMCHDASISGQLEAMWVDDAAGKPTTAPAVLQLATLLTTQADSLKNKPAEAHGAIVSLLAEASRESADPLLKYLHAQISTSDPGSPVWRHAVAQLGGELPNHARGEYAAKITRKTPPEELAAYHARLAELAGPYQQAARDSDERKRLHAEIHKGILEKPGACATCHGDDPPRVDLHALGYSPERAAALKDSAIAHLMQQIQNGQPFYLPKMLEGGHDRK